MNAPNTATMSNPANPERVTVSHRHGTEPGVRCGNNPRQALGKAVCQPQRK